MIIPCPGKKRTERGHGAGAPAAFLPRLVLAVLHRTCMHRPCSVVPEKPSSKELEESKHRALLVRPPYRIAPDPRKGMLEALQQRCLMRLHMRAALLALQDA